MASKYAGLKGRIPVALTERGAEVKAKMAEYADMSFDELTALYNATKAEAEVLSASVKLKSAQADALLTLLLAWLDAQDLDAARANGFTWSETFEPFPVVEDPAAIVQYFKDNHMEDQLELSTTELSARLKNFVKNEAMANELTIGTRMVPDPETGLEREVPDVRSKIPGVRVFLKAGLSRVKSQGAKK